MVLLHNLPQELLDIIITYAVVEQKPIHVGLQPELTLATHGFAMQCVSQDDLLGLALANSKLYVDTLPVYYTQNTFKYTIDGSDELSVKAWIGRGLSAFAKRKVHRIFLAFTLGFTDEIF